MKIWEATDLKMGRIETEKCLIGEEETNGIRLTRYYQFVDANGDVISDLGGHGISFEMKLTDIPQDVLSALQKIDTYTTTKAKEKEGLSG